MHFNNLIKMNDKRDDKKPSSRKSLCVVIALSTAVMLLCAVLLVIVVKMYLNEEVIRLEAKLMEHSTRIQALETRKENYKIQQEDQRNVDQKETRDRSRNRMRRNASASTPPSDLERLQKFLLDFCFVKNKNCVRGPPGPPGLPGKRGRRGQRGRRGPKGDMGNAGRFGKRGIMGPPGLKGDEGERGPQGMPGLKGDPGLSISAPDVTISPPHLVINESEPAVIHCSSSGNPRPSLVWTKVGGHSASSRTLSSADKLVISKAASNDSGVYQCQATNILGSEQQSARLTVNYKPRIAMIDRALFIKEGENVTLPPCHVTGLPTPKITWSRASSPLPHGRALIRDGQLSLIKLQKSDSDTYFCKAENSLGFAVKRIQLFVVKIPIFVKKPQKSVTITKGMSFSLSCIARGYPNPTISWKKVGDVLVSGGRSQIGGGTLTVTRAEVQDSGVYICTASIAGITAESTTQVTVTPRYLKVQLESRGIEGNFPSNTGGPVAKIIVDGVDYSNHGRGHNLAAFNMNGKLLSKTAFDTHGDTSSGSKMRDYINTLPDNTIVLVAVGDSAANHGSPANEALKSIGAKAPLQPASFRESWCLIGYKGGYKSWIRQDHKRRYDVPATVSADIQLD